MGKFIALFLLAFAAHAADFNCSKTDGASGAFSLSCAPRTGTLVVVDPPPPPPTPTSCNPQGGVSDGALGGLGLPTVLPMNSGAIRAFPLPSPPSGFSSQTVSLLETTIGTSMTVDMSISKCRGEINPAGGACYVGGPFLQLARMVWFSQGIPGIADKSAAEARGFCWAPMAEGQWYLNVRYTYSSCQFGVCGAAIQRNYGPY